MFRNFFRSKGETKIIITLLGESLGEVVMIEEINVNRARIAKRTSI